MIFARSSGPKRSNPVPKMNVGRMLPVEVMIIPLTTLEIVVDIEAAIMRVPATVALVRHTAWKYKGRLNRICIGLLDCIVNEMQDARNLQYLCMYSARNLKKPKNP